MKFTAGVVGALALLCCVAALDGNGTSGCPSIPSNKHFHESEVTHFWRATHYASSRFVGLNETTCLTVNIQKTDSGLSLLTEFLVDHVHRNGTTGLKRTNTSGIYEGEQPVATQVYHLHHGTLLIYGCLVDPLNQENFSVVLTRRHKTPSEALGYFKHFLNKHGVHVNYFKKFHNQHC